MQTIKISIVTINLNNLKGLVKTVESVKAQNYNYIEHIVIDGGSSDGSVDFLNNVKIGKVISEQDSGIYNAMNKGIILAEGEYLLFLNSGDFLYQENTISEIVKKILENRYNDIYFGDLLIDEAHAKYPKTINLDYLLNCSVPHPSAFIRKSLFNADEIGMYREDYTIVSDWIFFVKAYVNQYRFYHIDIVTTVFDPLGVSSSEGNIIERNHALKNLFPNFLEDIMVLADMKHYKGSRAHKFTRKLIHFFRKNIDSSIQNFRS